MRSLAYARTHTSVPPLDPGMIEERNTTAANEKTPSSSDRGATSPISNLPVRDKGQYETTNRESNHHPNYTPSHEPTQGGVRHRIPSELENVLVLLTINPLLQ